MRAILILGISLALSAAAFAQQMYRWVDASGRVHYTQTPPPADAKGVQKMRASTGAGTTSPVPYATQVATANSPVTLYVSADCGEACKEAVALLSKRGVPHRLVEVVDAGSLESLKRVSGGNTVPVLVVGAVVQKGFEASLYQSALDAAGYPMNAPPIPPQTQKPKPAPAPAPAPEQQQPTEAPAQATQEQQPAPQQ